MNVVILVLIAYFDQYVLKNVNIYEQKMCLLNNNAFAFKQYFLKRTFSIITVSPQVSACYNCYRKPPFSVVMAVKRCLAAEIDFSSVYYHNKRHVKFGYSRAVLKFGGWQLKNGKITGKKQKIGQKSVKKWSNGLDLSTHGSFLLHQDSPKKFIGLQL